MDVVNTILEAVAAFLAAPGIDVTIKPVDS
jgi:hypothetical protein